MLHQLIGTLLGDDVEAEHAAITILRITDGGEEGMMGVVGQARVDDLEAEVLHACRIGHGTV